MKKQHNPLTEPKPAKAAPYWVGPRRPTIEAQHLRVTKSLERAVRDHDITLAVIGETK